VEITGALASLMEKISKPEQLDFTLVNIFKMHIIDTKHDGWDCLPEMKDLSACTDMVARYKYEIDNCVRSSSVKDIVDAYRHMISEMEYTLRELEKLTDVEFVTYEF